jgi:hypothetical protein
MNCDTSVGEIRIRPSASSPALYSSVPSAPSATRVCAIHQSFVNKLRAIA